jgi:hypothetical protein
LVPLVTNIIHSMIFRYQSMAEKLMEASPLIDTITIRPGDLVNELRDEDTTSLQVNLKGTLPYPSRIGRDDVASIAVSAALFDFSNAHSQTKKGIAKSRSKETPNPPIHHTIACRWVGDDMDPFPPQGVKGDGHLNAESCLKIAFQSKHDIKYRTKFERKHRAKDYTNSILLTASKLKSKPLKIKPYGICVAIPVYVAFAMVLTAIFQVFTLQVGRISATLPFAPKAAKLVHQATSTLLLGFSHVWREKCWCLTMRKGSIPNYIQF